MPKGIPLTKEEQARRRQEIFDASIHLFLEKGFNETSMREIAEAAGIGKSTLYDYFASKDDILVSYSEDVLQCLIQRADEIAHQPIGAVEKLRRIMFGYMDYLAANEDFYVRVSTEVQRLPQDSLRRIQAKRHEYQDLIRSVIDEGIREGCFRPVDSLLAARVILTALMPAVFSTRPTGTPQQTMEEAFVMLMKGVQS